MSEQGRTQGSVKWFNETKGYGFIKLPTGGGDVFVHVNELRRSGISRVLQEGEAVSFVCDKRPKGLYATQVTLGEGNK